MPEIDNNFIVIDTNVFEHLLNEDKNIVLCDIVTKKEEKHINRFLNFMQKQGYILCIDKKSRIMEEYKYRLKETIKNAIDERNEIQILKYWILSDDAHYYSERKINLNLDRTLKDIILNDNYEPETTDCIFVHTAAINQCNLVTNDSDYTLCDQGIKQKDRNRTKNGKINSKNKQDSNLQNKVTKITNRKDQIKVAIQKNLKHEETDILTSLEAHETYLYPHPVVNNLD